MITGFVQKVKKWQDDRPKVNSFPTSHLETWEQRRARKNALLIIYIKTLIYFSVVAMVMPPTWPYLLSIDPSASKTLVGWIIIGVPALRPINALLVGWILRRFSIRLVTVVSGLFVMVSCAMWSTAYEAPIYGGYWLLFSRFVIGFFGAEFQIGTTHIATATTQEERSTSMTILAGCLSMAYMMAPGVMSALSYIGPEGVLVGSYRLNMYTVAGWLGFTVYGVCLLLFVIFFEENDIAMREVRLNKNEMESAADQEDGGDGSVEDLISPENTAKTDYLALGLCNVIAAHCYGWLQLPDTMMTPMLMDLYSWDEQTAVRRSGNLLTVYGLLALIGFIITGRLAKKFPERVMMLAGNVAYLVGSLVMFPLASDYTVLESEPMYSNAGNMTNIVSNSSIEAPNNMRAISWERTLLFPSSRGHSFLIYLMHIRSKKEQLHTFSLWRSSANQSSTTERLQLGCPVDMQPWCEFEPRPHLIQLILSFGISMVATPFVLPMVNSAVSKILPPGNHSFMWGVVNGSANIGRLIYPLLNIYMYTLYGPRVQYGIMIILCVLVVTLQLLVYKRLLPKNTVKVKDKIELSIKSNKPPAYGATDSNE